MGMVTDCPPLGCCVGTRQPAISVKGDDKTMWNSATFILPASCNRDPKDTRTIAKKQAKGSAAGSVVLELMISSRVGVTEAKLASAAPIAMSVMVFGCRTPARCLAIKAPGGAWLLPLR